MVGVCLRYTENDAVLWQVITPVLQILHCYFYHPTNIRFILTLKAIKKLSKKMQYQILHQVLSTSPCCYSNQAIHNFLAGWP